MFQQALSEVYNVDPSFATTLASQALQSLPHAEAGPNALHLADLNKHDVIEHDASLTRLDAIQGDNHDVQPKLVDALLADATGDFLTIQSLAKSRTRREAESKQAGSPALSAKASTLAYGESALLLQVLGHLGTAKTDGSEYLVPKPAARAWLLDEKLPAGWKRPPYVISLSSTTTLSARVLAAKAIDGVAAGAAALLGAAAKGVGQAMAANSNSAAAAMATHTAGAGHGAGLAYGLRVH
jgi:hypothetical protein